MKRLFIDIETSPTVGMFWSAGYRKFINYKNILRERAIICVAWKFQGKKLHLVTWDKNMDDKKLIERVIPAIERADEVVGHHIEYFDLPWLRTRALFHKLPQVPLVKVIDTCKWAKKYFYLQSNKLDYLARFLGVGGKPTEFTEGEGAWRRVMNNDRDALAEMAEYCANDVEGLLEPVYDRLSVVCPVHTHAGVLQGLTKWSCPRCASTKLHCSGNRVTAAGTIQHRVQCQDCGGWSVVSDKTYRDHHKEKYGKYIKQ